MSSCDNKKRIEQLTRDLVLSNDQLEKVASLLLHEMMGGLKKEQSSTLKMIPTYVLDVPDGTEQGKFLALDLGGTNFRVLVIELEGDKFHMDNEIYAIPHEIMVGSGEQLFDHIADCLAKFVIARGLENVRLPLGFTFSFPCIQEGLTKARLVTWTKGFKCSGVEGRDVVELLREALGRRKDIDIDVTAVVNDTTGTLMSCAHKNRQCRIGLIVGTGTNACYMEKCDNIADWDPSLGPWEQAGPGQVIVNTEWGAFGDNGVLEFVRTKWDRQVDTSSLNPSKQLFEKMISGMYMGEVARQVMLDMANQGLLLGGNISKKLSVPYSFDTALISKIESKSKYDYKNIRKVLDSVDLTHATEEDCESIRLICSRVSTRAAHLVSAGVATLLNKMRRPHTTVGVDGTVYRKHPHFHDLMEKKIADLTNPDYKFDLMLSEDGSGRGAALVAAVAVRHVKGQA